MLQLADVFENFRDKCMENYKLGPAWYYTSPGMLCWDAMLKRTGIREGVATASNRLGQANNKYVGEDYDSSKHSIYIYTVSQL